MTAPEAAAVVAQLLAAAGGREFDSRLVQFERLGQAGCDALFAVWGRRGDGPVGADGAHPRDVTEDVWHTLVVAARRWPDRFLEQILTDPSRHADIAVLDALGEVDRPGARALLVSAATDRRAGRAFSREYALRGLIRLADPSLPELLIRLVKDRAPAVRQAAVEAAAEHGDARLLPELRRTVRAEKTPAEIRSRAAQAIAAIVARGA